MSNVFVTSAPAAEAMGLSEAIAQSDWVRALRSEVVLVLNLRKWREQENVLPFISVTDSKGNYDHFYNKTVGTSEDRRGAVDLTIIREDQSRPRMFLRWVDGKTRVADALTKLRADGEFCQDNTSKDPFSRCEICRNMGYRLSGRSQRQAHH